MIFRLWSAVRRIWYFWTPREEEPAGSLTGSCWKTFSGPYFLAGGLSAENVGEAIARLRPFGVDVSSGIETGGYKDREKMTAFAAAVREEK